MQCANAKRQAWASTHQFEVNIWPSSLRGLLRCADTGKSRRLQISPIETACASALKYLSAHVCTGMPAVPAVKPCNSALTEILLLAARHDGAVRRCFRLCCLGQTTGCLKEHVRASRASTRLQLKSRTWHKHNLVLQGAMRGSKQGASVLF